MIKIKHPPIERKPNWLKIKLNTGENYNSLLFGPITIGTNGTLTIGTNSNLKIKDLEDV